MSDSANTAGMTKWVYVVIGLVAIIGLLAGLLISQSATPEPVSAMAQYQTEVPPDNVNNPPPSNQDTSEPDVRRILRNLTPDRRREILQQAMKNIEKSDDEHPRKMLQNRHRARLKTLEIARSEPFDANAMRAALEEVHKINLEMVRHGTDLTIEVLQLMTPEERQTATERGVKTRRERVQDRRQKRRDRRQED